jgi:hypothetical protein
MAPMKLKILRWSIATAALLMIASGSAWAQQVGEPASFTIAVKQGSQVIAQKHVTVGAGQDLPDIKTTYQDGDAESFVQLITMTSSGTPSPIILKLVSEPTQDMSMYRLLHFYIDVPLSLQQIDSPGAVSLFDPHSADPIEVTVTDMVFANGIAAIPQLGNDPYFYTSFMRDHEGHFYQSPQAHPYGFAGHSIYDIQVPGTAYLDADTSQYTFASTSGVSSSWTWGKIPNPGQTTKVHNGSGLVTPSQPGYVFELGLAVAFTAMPEPATAGLLLLGGMLLIRRRR